MTAPALLDDPDAIVGASGAGKSYTARKKAEQLLEVGRQVIIFDPTGVWYGLRSNAAGTGAGFDVPIFGGPRGDIPIRPADGAAIARLLIDEGASAILDLSTFEEHELRLFALGFLDVLRHRERANLHLIFDEAEEFAPQTAPDDVGFQLVRRMTWIAKRGRVFGLVPTFITQRPADFAKAVLSQVQTLVFHQLIAPADQAPVKAYLKSNADKATLQTVETSLPALERGERWIYSPRRGVLERGTTAPIATFDTMATPAPGEAKREPKTLAKLDLAKIRKALADANPATRTPADPIAAYDAALIAGDALIARDRRIAELEAQVVALTAEVAELTAEVDEREAECEGYSRKCDYARSVLDAALDGRDVPAPPIYADGATLRLLPARDFRRKDQTPAVVADVAGGALSEQPPAQDLAAPFPPRVGKRAAGADQPPSPAALLHAVLVDGGGFNAAARDMAKLLVAVATDPITWSDLAVLTGRKPNSGYMRAARKQLVEGGWVWTLEGSNAAPAAAKQLIERADMKGGAWPLPSEILERWTLKGPAHEIIRDLIANGPATRSALGDRLGRSSTSGHFRSGVKDLLAAGLAREGPGGVLTPHQFLCGDVR